VVVLGVVLCGALIVGGVIVLPDILPLIGPTPTGSGVIFGDQAPVLLVNNLDLSVCYFYISPSGSSEWGEDWLGSDRIGAGESRTFYVDAGQTVDLRAEDCQGGGLDEQYDIYVPSEGITYTLGP